MICYMDKTFCVSEECENKCDRQLTEEIKRAADALDLPISCARFCEEEISYNGVF